MLTAKASSARLIHVSDASAAVQTNATPYSSKRSSCWPVIPYLTRSMHEGVMDCLLMIRMLQVFPAKRL